ncbi:MAG TPA: hypothetical protein VHW44_14380 [Pseudonocardiaceae bacterium]|jgi:hypothetical protein|nr:hypothetical protein [Pseudonocardiaceae bacterium]
MSTQICEQTLHMLRIRGRITLEQLAEGLDVDADAIAGALAELTDNGFVRNSGKPRIPWSIAEAGRQLAERRMTGISAAAKARCGEHYQRFQGLNGELKQLCADWQARDTGTAAADFVPRLAPIDDAVQDTLRQITPVAPAFAMYGRRLSRAKDLFADGAGNYLTGIMVDSYHTAWFELHECFFVTLGRSRQAEEIPRPSHPVP